MAHLVQEICERVSGRLIGDGTMSIEGIEILSQARPNQITFIRDVRHARDYQTTRAGAVLVSEAVKLTPLDERPIIYIKNADHAMITVLSMFAPPRSRPPVGVHPSACIDPTAVLGEGVTIGPFCIVGANARIGARCVLHANVSIGEDCRIDEDCELFQGVVIGERCELGRRVVLRSNVVIGSDGFGYQPAPDGRGVVRVPHIGAVEIGDDVEIGASSCVDRGKFSNTTIGAGTKIDNLCQIAHNCKIGRSCLIAGQSGIAGSAVLGDGVIVGGRVAIKDQVVVGDNVKLAACSAIMGDVPSGATWAGYPGRDILEARREHVAMRRLPELVKLLRTDRRQKQAEQPPHDAV